jgi:hypothetical protein
VSSVAAFIRSPSTDKMTSPSDTLPSMYAEPGVAR